MKHAFKLLFALLILAQPLFSQTFISDDLLNFYTSEWEGERYEDGRPRVSDDLLKRLKNISIEEAWGVLRGEGFHNQFEAGWKMLHEDEAFVGRALTAQYMPLRPDVNQRILDTGHENGQIGASNSWPIDALQMGDVYVADCFGKVINGTLIGDNLGNSIFAKSGTGVVFDAGSRDLEGLSRIEGFNAFVRDWDPSFLTETMLTGINYSDTDWSSDSIPRRCGPGQKRRCHLYSSALVGEGCDHLGVYRLKRQIWTSNASRRHLYSRADRRPMV